MREFENYAKQITNPTIQQDPTGYSVTWQARDGKTGGVGRGATLKEAYAAAQAQAARCGWELV